MDSAITSGRNAVDFGPTLIISAWVEAGVAIVVVALRLYTKIFVSRKLSWDDHVMTLSLILALFCNSFMTVSQQYGLGRHINSLTTYESQQAQRYFLYRQPFVILAPAAGRISYLMFLLKLVPWSRKWSRWLLYILIFLQLAVNIVNAVLLMTQCQPIAKFWDRTLPGVCWDRLIIQNYSYFQGSFNALTDAIMALVPVSLLWSVKIKMRVKLVLIVLMGLGLLAMAASCIKTWYLRALGSANDYTYTVALLSFWAGLEMFLVIIAASVPVLKPLWSPATKISTDGWPISKEPYYGNGGGGNRSEQQQDEYPLRTIPSRDDDDDVESKKQAALGGGGSSQGTSTEGDSGIRKTTDFSVNITDREKGDKDLDDGPVFLAV